jgi:hypothetical protein
MILQLLIIIVDCDTDYFCHFPGVLKNIILKPISLSIM